MALCYSEESIKRYMLHDLEDVGPASAWQPEDFQQEYLDLCLLCGVSDIAQAEDPIMVRSLARVVAWRKLVRAASGEYDFKDDGGEYKVSQVAGRAQDVLRNAESAAAPWLLSGNATGYSDSSFQVATNVAVW
jgi:hypothetical protein